MSLEKKIRKSMEDSQSLPAMATVVTRLMSLVAEGAGTRDVAKVVSEDPALSTRLLKVANSSLYAVYGEINTVQKAVTLLGLEVVSNLALTLSVLDIFPLNDSKLFNYPKFWSFSLFVGVIARTLSEVQKDLNPQECFTAGLLHNMGVLFLARTVPDEYSQTLSLAGSSGKLLWEVEREVLGLDHCEVGKLLAEAWKLPSIVCQAAATHHDLGEPESDDSKIVEICNRVKSSIRITHALGKNNWDQLEVKQFEQLLNEVECGADAVGQAVSLAEGEVAQSAEMFGLNRLAVVDLSDDYQGLKF